MNNYVAYVIAMAVILVIMTGTIGSINFVVGVAGQFYRGDWAYRRKVLLIVGTFLVLFTLMASYSAYHIVTDLPE